MNMLVRIASMSVVSSSHGVFSENTARYLLKRLISVAQFRSGLLSLYASRSLDNVGRIASATLAASRACRFSFLVDSLPSSMAARSLAALAAVMLSLYCLPALVSTVFPSRLNRI